MKYALILMAACYSGPRATAEDCQHIIDRLVAIELNERGYRDPKLLETRTQEMRFKFASRLPACVGRPLPEDARRCIDGAKTTESLVHACLGRN